MTITDANVKQQINPEYVESVVSYNVKLLLASEDLNQTDLANALGISRSAASYKLSGKSVWSVPDLVVVANFLGVHAGDLLDDSLMKQLQNLGNNKAVAADTRPRYLVMPNDGEVCPGCDSNARHLL